MPYLTPQQERLRDDIRGLIKGEVRCDEITLQLYSTDASLIQCRPQGVVWPRDIDDVVACVAYGRQKGLTLHARGSGTGTAGDSLGKGLILDFSRFMSRIVDQDAGTVTVQPGITHRRLNAHLRKSQSRCFGPVSGFRAATTIGSLLARDGAGPNWLQYGFPSDYLVKLKVVLADGQVVTLRRDAPPQAIETAQNDAIRGLSKSAAFLGDDSVAKGIALARGIVLGPEHVIADEIYRVLNSSYYEVDQELTGSLPVNRAGYRCRDILIGPGGTHVDLAALMAGSEGTLGLIVEATLKTLPRPERGAAAVLFFSSLEKAVHAVHELLPFRPVLCELIDRRRLSMVREIDDRLHHILPIEAEAVVLVELAGGEDTAGRLSELIEHVQERSRLCFRSIRVETPDMFAHLDAFLHHADLILFRMRRSYQPLPLFHDLALPLDSLGSFLPEVLGTLRQHDVTASISGHIGQGQLRIHPIVDLSRPHFGRALRKLADDVYFLVRKHHGTLSSEGATGFLKSPFLPEQYPRLTPIFRNIKEVFDPNDLFQPGKIVPDAVRWTDRLRRGLPHRGMDHPDRESTASVFMEKTQIGTDSVLLSPSDAFPEPAAESDAEPGDHSEWNSQLELQLKWEPQHVFESTYLCNGCGDCFQENRRSRMCPLFRCVGDEVASPRAIPNLLRGVLEEELDLETLTLDQARDVMGACFHCQMCQVECPAEVDVAALAFRGKSAYVAAHGLSLDDLFFSRIDAALQWLGMISCPVNWSLSNRVTRWILEKLLQIPQARKLPKLAKVSYLGQVQWSAWRGKQRPATSSRNVALFVDTYANHFDTKLADLAVRVLEHNGLNVFVPLRQRASGLIPFALGNMHRAERLARHNALLLADLVRQGYQVVTLEPASASCMTQDYPYVVDDIDMALLRSHVVDFCEFLLQLHREDALRLDFTPLPKTVGYHAPCRSISRTTRRVDARTPAEELLHLIPELEVRRLEQGCCGMAGTYGLKQRNYRRSLRIGRALFRELRDDAIDLGATDCSACRLQMEHGARKDAWHPIRLLAAAYGIAPDLSAALEL